MSDRLEALRLFTHVAHRNSISAAARDLRLTQPTASRMLATLEKNLGTSLFFRSTRMLKLTEAGAKYLERVERVLAELEEADHEARGASELTGTFRIAVSSSVAVREVIPRLPLFAARHPALKLVLVIDDRHQSLTELGVDLAIRVGPLQNSSALLKRLGSWPVAVVSAPSLVQRLGLPSRPQDLTTFPTIVRAECGPQIQVFRHAGTTQQVELAGTHVIGSNEGCLAAARAGLGLLFCATLAARQDLDAGTLVRLLPDWDLGRIEVSLLFSGHRAVRPAARAFASFIIEQGILGGGRTQPPPERGNLGTKKTRTPRSESALPAPSVARR